MMACLLTMALPDLLLQVKGLFDKLGVPYKAVDMDTIGELEAADTASPVTYRRSAAALSAAGDVSL